MKEQGTGKLYLKMLQQQKDQKLYNFNCNYIGSITIPLEK